MSREELLALAAKVDACTAADNALDVLVDCALFEPGRFAKAIRPNAAGTKIIVTDARGGELTYHAWDWTMDKESRTEAAASLRSRAAMGEGL